MHFGEGAKVGNFCEAKKSEISERAKVNYLTYIGDAFVGAGANMRVGTITYNYDRVNKHITLIGPKSSIGLNLSLFVFINTCDGPLIASGRVVTDNVLANAADFGSTRQVPTLDMAKYSPTA
ncbi:hypothetical protein C8J38_1403 [Rhizobium sp. PP-WC-2G-219]|nr:hypothetical protein C8J38_1403 [Rhizobium sp. PP-WC-2G-219]